MIPRNPYEYLKLDCLGDVDPVDAQATWRVTQGTTETITILSSLLPCGAWVYGYLVNWANGRTSAQLPTAKLGRFRTQREAKLYAIGYMLLYLDYFLPETRADLLRGEKSLLQPELF